MFRVGIAVAALAAFASVAGAQPQLPLAPGVAPTSPIGPGAPFPAGPITQRPGPNSPGVAYFPVALPSGWGIGWAYQTYNPWTGFSYAYGGLVPNVPPPQPTVVVEQSKPAEPTVILANEFPATLTIQFPAAAEVWLDGKKVKGGSSKERVLTSPVMKSGQRYTFDVTARWTRSGKTYEIKRTVTLGPGDSSELAILSGDEVRE